MARNHSALVPETTHEQESVIDEARIPLHLQSDNEEESSLHRVVSLGRDDDGDNHNAKHNVSIVLKDDSDGPDDVSSTDEEDDGDDGLVCPICLEYSSPRSMVAGPCQHSFCISCLSQMLIMKHKKNLRRARRRQEQSRTDYGESGNDDDNDDTNFSSGWTKTIEGGGLCPLCRASLPLKELRLIHDDSRLSDDEFFQQILQQYKQQHCNNDDEEEGRALVVSRSRRRTRRSTVASAALSMIYGDQDGRNRERMDRIALSFCVLFMLSITLVVIVVQVRLAGNFHNDYYNEADTVYPNDNDFEEEIKGGKCLPPMPADCHENGLYQCPPKSQSLSGQNQSSAAHVITLGETQPDAYETYPMQIASCASSVLPSISTSKSELLTYQKYAWATVEGTGGWMRVERYASISPCDGTELEVYVLDGDANTCHSPSSAVSQRDGSHVGYAHKSCEFDPNCLLSSPTDLWSVHWLSQEGIVYAIFDERRRGIDLSSELDEHSELRFTMMVDEPTNQLCQNAVTLEPNSDVPYYFHDRLLVDSKTFPNSMCGVDNLNTNTGLWFQTTAPPRPRSASVQLTQLVVSVCSEDDWFSDEASMSLLILQGTDCNKFGQLPHDDLKCVASLTVNRGLITAPTTIENLDADRESSLCRYLTWNSLPNETYLLYFEGSPSLRMGGSISIFS